MKIYLAGSVPKGDKEAENYTNWRKDYFKVISQQINDVELLDASDFYKLEGNSKALFGAECLHIKESDLIVVNAEEKLGAGTSMELVIAKYFCKPVIIVLPKDSAHRRSNLTFENREVKDWIHPFIDSFSDVIVENISDIKIAIEKIKNQKIKEISVIEESMKYAKNILNNL